LPIAGVPSFLICEVLVPEKRAQTNRPRAVASAAFATDVRACPERSRRNGARLSGNGAANTLRWATRHIPAKQSLNGAPGDLEIRSEERRVGKERRSRSSPEQEQEAEGSSVREMYRCRFAR